MSLQKFLSDFAALGDRDLKMEYLIELAGHFKAPPADVAAKPYAESNKVPGCESEVYVWARREGEDSKLRFYFAVENPQGVSAKALAVILDRYLSGHSVDYIADISPEIIYQLFGEELTMARGQGLMNMILAVKQLTLQNTEQEILNKSKITVH
ncbi:MAG TPA: SufE family protein [Oligoflexia bacterium]|nr:SufE family protein [Oligoflexia bacterium]HMP26737.1 SufE family protein [Oligoflexia bacterium]